MTTIYPIHFSLLPLNFSMAEDLNTPIRFEAGLVVIDLPYGLYLDQTKCKVAVPNAYVDQVKACANLWELQALFRIHTRGTRYLSTDNDLVDQQWLNNVGAIRQSVTLWRIPLAVSWIDQIWVKLNVSNLIPDAYVAKDRDDSYGLIDPLPARVGTIKQLYFNYCGQELKPRK